MKYVDVDAFSALLTELFCADRLELALVISALYLLHRDPTAASRLSQDQSHDVELCGRAWDAFAAAANLRPDLSMEAELVSPRELARDALNLQPLFLLTWLGERLVIDATDPARLPEWVFCNGVVSVQLDPSHLDRLGLSRQYTHAFVWRRDHHEPEAPMERQHVNTQRWLKDWQVLPCVPSLAQPSRTVRVITAADAFRQSCEQASAKDELALYLAEVHDVLPCFDSHWTAHGQARLWHAKGLLNEAALTKQLLNHLESARALGAQFVLFPELLVPRGAAQALAQWLSENASFHADEPDHGFIGVLAGSFHEPQPPTSVDADPVARPHNRALLLDRLGLAVRGVEQVSHTVGQSSTLSQFAQTKLTSVDLGNVIENNEKSYELVLLRSALGIQAVAICLDLAQQAAGDVVPWDHLPVRWLWAPSLSESTRAHLARADVLCKQRTTTVVCVNQAKAQFGTIPGTEQSAQIDGRHHQSFVSETASGRKVTHHLRDGKQHCGAGWLVRVALRGS